jgi:ubiquitin-conjugating enzyme E2 D/E
MIEGPGGSPFEDGVFALNAIMPSDYPFSPPRITFETPVYHCNVSDSGKICLDILQDKWSPNLSVPKCLEAIRLMLKEPDTDNSLRQWIAELTLAYKKSNGADNRYIEKAVECTRNDASLSVADWKAKWGC